jgi:hypothetical protein
MRQIFRDYAARVSEGELGFSEGDAMFVLVVFILLRVPLEPGLRHRQMVNTKVIE